MDEVKTRAPQTDKDEPVAEAVKQAPEKPHEANDWMAALARAMAAADSGSKE